MSSLLGLSHRPSGEDIRAAYWALAKEFHPDVHAGDKEAERRIKEINRAYGILGDPEARAAYNLILTRARVRARRSFWRAAATGAAAFLLTVGSISVTVMWRQHAEIQHSWSDKPGLPTRLAKSDWLVAKPPAEQGAEVVSTAPPAPFGEQPPSASPKITSTALRDSEAQSRGAPAAQSLVMLERPTNEEDRSAASAFSEPSNTVSLEVGPQWRDARSPVRSELANVTRKVGTTGIKRTAHRVCWLKHGYYRKCTWYGYHRYRYYD
jgi:curved DNA-binding protein CbpA